ncbi:MAG: hypothetical protein ACFFG0_01850 [Candidatus Thorarchaeota archaeon]
MRIKLSFITNSSSTAFLITNISDEPKTLVDFVLENPQLIEEFKEEYSWHANNPRYSQILLAQSAKQNNIEFEPNERKECVFGDEDGTLIGHVFDYILRTGGKSKSFKWELLDYRR